jgi:hypothetical protein
MFQYAASYIDIEGSNQAHYPIYGDEPQSFDVYFNKLQQQTAKRGGYEISAEEHLNLTAWYHTGLAMRDVLQQACGGKTVETSAPANVFSLDKDAMKQRITECFQQTKQQLQQGFQAQLGY